MTNEYARQRVELEKVNCDREAWVLARIKTAIQMARVLDQQQIVGADCTLLNYALDGLMHGAAAEIIKTLGLEPSYVNIRRPSDG